MTICHCVICPNLVPDVMLGNLVHLANNAAIDTVLMAGAVASVATLATHVRKC
jgi:hypothetical protein